MSESTIKVDTISCYDSTNVNLSTGNTTRIAISGLATSNTNGIIASLPVQISGLVTVGEDCTVSSGQYATSSLAPAGNAYLCNKTYVDGKIKVKATVTPAAAATTITTFPSSYTFPTNTFLIHGYAFHPMSGNNGTRLDAQFYNSANAAVGTRFAISGGNELPNGDGGRGMTCRWNFMIGVPEGATYVRLSRGESTSQAGIGSGGSQAMTVLINQTVVIA